MKLQALEFYLSAPSTKGRRAGVVFEVGQAFDLHLGAPVKGEVYVQLRHQSERVLMQTKVCVNNDETYSSAPIQEGLDLAPTVNMHGLHEPGPYLFLIATLTGDVIGACPFFITQRSAPAKILYLHPTNTINAYSYTQQVNAYTKGADGETVATQLSFHRTQAAKPFNLYFASGLSWLLSLQEPIRWACDRDAGDPRLYEGIKLIVLGGHSEYWSTEARDAFDAAIAAGAHALVLSGNTMWWRVRVTEQANQQWMDIYRQPHRDPLITTDPHGATTLWKTLGRSPLTSIGASFDHGGYPIQRKMNVAERLGVHHYEGNVLHMLKDASPLTQLISEVMIPIGDGIEFDGMPVKSVSDDLSVFEPDYDLLEAHCANILGFMFGFREGQHTLGTAHFFQKTRSHGGVFQVGSISAFGVPFKRSEAYRDLITVATLALLGDDLTLFYPKPQTSRVFLPYQTPHAAPLYGQAQLMQRSVQEGHASLSVN